MAEKVKTDIIIEKLRADAQKRTKKRSQCRSKLLQGKRETAASLVTAARQSPRQDSVVPSDLSLATCSELVQDQGPLLEARLGLELLREILVYSAKDLHDVSVAGFQLKEIIFGDEGGVCQGVEAEKDVANAAVSKLDKTLDFVEQERTDIGGLY